MDITDTAGAACLDYLIKLITRELEKQFPDIAQISVALGVVETALASKDEADRNWPMDLPGHVADCLSALQTFVSQQAAATAAISDPREKIKIIADAVWGKLTSSSKDLLHAQHVYSFAKLLLPEHAKTPRRHLDCAGVTTTTYTICKVLGLDVYMQVSEDHCFLNLDRGGSREGSVEVTTDTAAKRAKPAEHDAWAGWLYNGGHALLCRPRQVVAALITSIHPIVTPGKSTSSKKKVYCERLQALQYHLLLMLRRTAPDALYPAAIYALADLQETVEEDAVEAALETGDAAAVETAVKLDKGNKNSALALFEEAIAMAAPEGGVDEQYGWQWYPYSSIIGFLCRRSCLMEESVEKIPFLSSKLCPAAVDAFREALSWAAKGSAVLTRYKFRTDDEELCKDLYDGVLEYCQEGLEWYYKLYGNDGLINDASLLSPVLTFWDGVCVYYAERAKPDKWVTVVLKIAKLFSEEARGQAAEAAEVRSSAMQRARHLWGPLNPKVLKGVFAAADVEVGEDGRAGKRARAR